MGYTYSFEKLEIWKSAKDLAKLIYSLTRDFPRDEKFGLISQINRSTISISANIAEGSTRLSKKDQAHFLQIAFGSAVELISHLIISYELKLINQEEYLNLLKRIEEITNKINAYRKCLLLSK